MPTVSPPTILGACLMNANRSHSIGDGLMGGFSYAGSPSSSTGITTRQSWWFWLGLFAFWAASDWPIGPLGAGYLASVHMAQYLIYTIIAAPLFVLASPEWWVRQVLARRRLYRVVAWASRPLYAAIIANVILLATNFGFTYISMQQGFADYGYGYFAAALFSIFWAIRRKSPKS